MNRASLNIISIKYLRFLRSALIVILFFASLHLHAQVISNNGTVISITSGTTVVSQDFSNTSPSGRYRATLRNFGTLNLSGNFTNGASSITRGDGVFRLGGNWSNMGIFIYGTSTVILNGSADQIISKPSPEDFFNLSLENTGASSGYYIKLENSVRIRGTLLMNAGNVMTSNHILYLVNQASNSLNYTSGVIFGLFERGISERGRFLFPLGNLSRPSYYNPATLVIRTTPTVGSVLGEFITSPPPGNAGLPLVDNSVNPRVEVDNAFTTGYWSMTAKNSFSVSNYNIELDATGFNNATDAVRENTRVIKRTTGDNWTLDGAHVDATAYLVRRNNLTGNISTSGTQFALGQAKPLITGHPESLIVCENSFPTFTVTASGTEPLTYIWYKNGTIIPPDDPHYTGSRLATLTINGATLADAGTYHCVVRDRFLSTTTSNPATLNVNRMPVATAFPLVQSHACSEIPFENIVLGLSNYDPGTRFAWNRETHANIVTTIPASGTEYDIGYVLSGSFNNTSNAPITIRFTIVPIGPAPTHCTGQPIYSSITVNPKPQIIPVVSEICYGANAVITLVSNTELTMPIENVLQFGYRAYSESSYVGGFTGPRSNVAYGTVVSNQYFNEFDMAQSVIYKVVPTFTSALGCLPGDSVSFEIKVHAEPLRNVIITQPLTCDGGSNATLQAITSRGAGDYYFKWERGTSERIEGYNLNELTNRRAGLWDVTVTDNLGCSGTGSIFVSGSRLEPYMYSPADGYHISCNGSADGQIRVMETGTGTAPFEYWIVKSGQDTASTSLHGYIYNKNVYTNLTGLTSGTYTLYMKDANGCYSAGTQRVELLEPQKITIALESKKYTGNFDVSCKGYSDGEVWVKTISGGNGGYTYKWTTTNGVITGVDNLNKIENIPAGKYYLHVTDIKGCTAIDSIIITEPLGMNLDLSIENNISCNGGSDGYINITISGGMGAYTYQWTGPDGFTSNQKNISQLKAGVYSCIVRDINGCILTPIPSFTLTEPPEINISTTLSTSAEGGYNINCNGGTGSVQVTVTGGISDVYHYIWSTTNGSGIVAGQKDQTSLKAGNYVLTVRDMNGCEKSTNITLTQPDALSLQFTTKHITCLSTVFDDGAINLTALGGVSPYSYVWSNGATTKDILGLTEGRYSVTVTDRNGCTATGSVVIVNPPLLEYKSQISNYNGFNVSCLGMSNGYINIDITAGTPPYMFSWTGPDGFNATTRNISGLKAGAYTVHITDNLGCETTQTFNLSEPDNQLGINISVSSSLDGRYNINCTGDRTGYIDIEPVNNIGRVEYLWSDGLFGKTRNNLQAGRYNVIITDSNGCSTSSSVTLTEPDPLKINFIVTKPYCPDTNDGSIDTEVRGGVVAGNYNYQWSNNSVNSSLANINIGWYSLTIEDFNGCIAKDSVKVDPQNRACLVIPNAISPNDDLINDVWNIQNIHLYPEAEVRIFNRWGNIVWVSEKGYPRPWDGTREGRVLPVDSYHYIIDLHNGDKPIIGTITIVR